MQATQSVSPRPGITAPDGDISTLTHYPCEDASVIRLGAVCTTAGATLSCRIIFLDAVGGFAGASSAVTFTADATSLDGRSTWRPRARTPGSRSGARRSSRSTSTRCRRAPGPSRRWRPEVLSPWVIKSLSP